MRTMEALLTDAAAQRLSDGIARGDPTALAELYETRFDWMLDLVMRTTRRDESFALDCAQDAWMRVARGPVRCASAASLDAWLRRVALTAALDRVRSDAARRAREFEVGDRARRQTAEFVDEVEGTLESIDSVKEALSLALERCGSDDRALLLMRFRAGMTLGQIAAACGLGAAAVDSRLRRLLASMRETLEETEVLS